MPKPLLTPQNIKALTANLYLKPDADIILEASAVSADFSSWLKDNFDLTVEEGAYIATYPDKVNKFYGHLFAAGFLSKSQITMAAAPNNPAPRRTKETRANLIGDIQFNDSDQDLTGSIDMKISFALL